MRTSGAILAPLCFGSPAPQRRRSSLFILGLAPTGVSLPQSRFTARAQGEEGQRVGGWRWENQLGLYCIRDKG